ncbi:hypothetical protein CaCOL14_012913 [Colletotrichum acutatum]
MSSSFFDSSPSLIVYSGIFRSGLSISSGLSLISNLGLLINLGLSESTSSLTGLNLSISESESLVIKSCSISRSRVSVGSSLKNCLTMCIGLFPVAAITIRDSLTISS